MVRFVMRVVISSSMLILAGIAPATVSAVTLTPPPPAAAECEARPWGTICTLSETFQTPGAVPYGVTCDGSGVRVQLSGERRFTFIYDESGVLVKRIRHASFSGTLTNPASGASVPHIGHFNIVDDYVAGTTTITGVLSRTVVNGEGLVWRNIGRLVQSLSNGAILAEAGEHGTFDVIAGDTDAAAELCAALS